MLGSLAFVLVWFAFAPTTSYADQEVERPGETLARQQYISFDSVYKRDFNTLYSDLWSEMQKKNPNLSEEDENVKVIKSAMVDLVYQRMINNMICAELYNPEAGNKPGVQQSVFEHIWPCMEEKNANTAEMWKFEIDYFALDRKGLNITLCQAKTRLIRMEMRYPPYDWMKAISAEPRKAYDSKAFLECVRKSE